MPADSLTRELFIRKNCLALAAWKMPHDLRRRLFQLAFPKKYQIYLERLHNTRGNTLDRGIFVHIPKTAGISLTRAIYGNVGPSHMSISHYQLLYIQRDYDTAFKFTFVRNPWDRAVSAYTFLLSGGYTEQDKIFAERYMPQFKTFAGFVKGWLKPENLASRIHFLPQHWFVCDPFQHLAVDFVGKFEALHDDFSYIARRLNIDTALEHKNATSGRQKDYRSYYDDEAIEIIARLYERDIELFDYSFDH